MENWKYGSIISYVWGFEKGIQLDRKLSIHLNASFKTSHMTDVTSAVELELKYCQLYQYKGSTRIQPKTV